MEKLKFDKFLELAGDSNSIGYVVYGQDFIYKLFLDIAKASDNYEVVDLSNNLKEQLKRLRYRSLLAPRKLAFYTGKVDKDVVELFNRYVETAVPHVLIIIHYEDKPRLLRSFAKGIKIVDMRYPGYNWVSDYTKHLTLKYKAEWTKGIMRFFLARVGREYQKINNYIQLLVEGGNIITKDDVLDVVEDDSLSSSFKFYSMLVQNSKVKKPYQAYQDFVDSGIKPQNLWYGFREYMRLLYQAKMLRMYGIVMPGSIIEIRKPALEKLPFELGDDHILLKPAYYVEQMLEVADSVTLRRILQVQLFIGRSFKTTKTGKSYVDENDVFISFVNMYNNEMSYIDPQFD